jgi:TPR repeat protein
MHSQFFISFLPVFFCAAIGMQGCTSDIDPSKTNTPNTPNTAITHFDIPAPADYQLMEELDGLWDSSEIIQRMMSPFSCVHEKDVLPRLDSDVKQDVEQLYQHALYLENKFRRDAKKATSGIPSEYAPKQPNPAEYQKAVWLFRLAAAMGHSNASKQLVKMLGRNEENQFESYDFFARSVSSLSLEEIVGATLAEMADDLIKRGIPYGYYLKGTLLDKEYSKKGSALWYLRRAADMGNPEAQYGFFDRYQRLFRKDSMLELQILRSFGKEQTLREHPELAEDFKQDDIVEQMVSCAAEQGHGDAANALGKTHQSVAFTGLGAVKADMPKGHYAEAVKYFQIAVKAGNIEAARSLSDGFANALPNLKKAEKQAEAFRASPPGENLEMFRSLNSFLNLPQDEERSRRYDEIMRILHANNSLELTVDELDTILPLPSRRLPAWDGKIIAVKRLENNEAPPLPSEQSIAKIARSNGMEPTFEPKLSAYQQRFLPFTCTFEKDHMPQLDPDVDTLYRQAKYLFQQSGANSCNCEPRIERDFRIAGAWGHKEALQYFETELGFTHSRGNVSLSLYLIDAAEKLIKRDIPYGYFLMGIMLRSGEDEAWKQRGKGQIAGCDQVGGKCDALDEDDEKRAEEGLRYYRKAADLGNPEAQYQLQKTLRAHPEMLQCAAEQGYDIAVADFAEKEKNRIKNERYAMDDPDVERSDVLEILNSAKQAQKAGDKNKASREYLLVMNYLITASRGILWDESKKELIRVLEGFIEPSTGRSVKNLRLFEGDEGERRLALITSKLQSYKQSGVEIPSKLPATIDEIGGIVRLPSAELPSWESISRSRGAAPSPQLSEERIKSLACAQGLDPQTGLPTKTPAPECAK